VEVGTRVDALRCFGDRVYVNGSREEAIVVHATVDPPVVLGTHDVADWVRGVAFSSGLACRLGRHGLEVAVTNDAP
jgi:hypothetical protein